MKIATIHLPVLNLSMMSRIDTGRITETRVSPFYRNTVSLGRSRYGRAKFNYGQRSSRLCPIDPDINQRIDIHGRVQRARLFVRFERWVVGVVNIGGRSSRFHPGLLLQSRCFSHLRCYFTKAILHWQTARV